MDQRLIFEYWFANGNPSPPEKRCVTTVTPDRGWNEVADVAEQIISQWADTILLGDPFGRTVVDGKAVPVEFDQFLLAGKTSPWLTRDFVQDWKKLIDRHSNAPHRPVAVYLGDIDKPNLLMNSMQQHNISRSLWNFYASLFPALALYDGNGAYLPEIWFDTLIANADGLPLQQTDFAYAALRFLQACGVYVVQESLPYKSTPWLFDTPARTDVQQMHAGGKRQHTLNKGVEVIVSTDGDRLWDDFDGWLKAVRRDIAEFWPHGYSMAIKSASWHAVKIKSRKQLLP